MSLCPAARGRRRGWRRCCGSKPRRRRGAAQAQACSPKKPRNASRSCFELDSSPGHRHILPALHAALPHKGERHAHARSRSTTHLTAAPPSPPAPLPWTGPGTQAAGWHPSMQHATARPLHAHHHVPSPSPPLTTARKRTGGTGGTLPPAFCPRTLPSAQPDTKRLGSLGWKQTPVTKSGCAKVRRRRDSLPAPPPPPPPPSSSASEASTSHSRTVRSTPALSSRRPCRPRGGWRGWVGGWV